jgi:hypothetical protein
MSKTIKISQEDLERIVENIVKEQEWKGSTDPEIMQLGQQGPEEIPGADQYDDSEDQEPETSNDGTPVKLAKDEEGNYYVIQDNGDKPKIFKINKR